MKLTPLDIRKQEFKRVMRGLDPDEVEAFLTMVADEFELAIREKNQLNDELIKLRTQLKDYQQVESTLRETLVKAQNTVEESRTNSRREAEIIIHEAELQAEHIIKEAREDLSALRNDVHMLKMQKESFAKRLRHLLESQIELLQVMEMDDVEVEEILDRFEPPTRVRGRPSRPPQQEEQNEQDSFRPARSEPRIVRDEPVQDRDQEHPDEEDSDSLSDQVI